MIDDEPPGFFRGNEFSRLLLFLAIAISGWALVWFYLLKTPDVVREPQPVVEGRPAPIVPDASPEFETVTDKTPLAFRDSAAYKKLLDQARELTPTGLAAKARFDVTYAHLWQDPKHYRGVPIHILGAARRVLRYESKMSKTGWLYEAWIITPDLTKNPYVCVFEDAPRGFPIGEDVSERVVFNGYFLKIMKYQAGDMERGAPLLVGRIGWTPNAAPVGSSNRSVYWLAGGVAIMFLISLVRWCLYLKRSLTPQPRRDYFGNVPVDVIAPDELSAFLEDIPDEPSEKSPS